MDWNGELVPFGTSGSSVPRNVSILKAQRNTGLHLALVLEML